MKFEQALIKQRIEKWRALEASERRLLFRLLALLPLIGLGLRLLGYKKLLSLLDRFTHYPRGLEKFHIDDTTAEVANRVAQLVAIVASCGPYRATCLHKSISLWWLLRRRGMPAELRIGVKKWISVGGARLG